jgi:hypothetical protein
MVGRCTCGAVTPAIIISSGSTGKEATMARSRQGTVYALMHPRETAMVGRYTCGAAMFTMPISSGGTRQCTCGKVMEVVQVWNGMV